MILSKWLALDFSVAILMRHGFFFFVDGRSALGTPMSGKAVIFAPLQLCERSLALCSWDFKRTRQYVLLSCCQWCASFWLLPYFLYLIHRRIFLLMPWADLCTHLGAYPTTADCFWLPAFCSKRGNSRTLVNAPPLLDGFL